jgi:Arc/MetJ-type ribon-helix-helix transcriptional regulator
MERTRISVQISNEEKLKIEQAIKRDYPKLKNVSDVVRASLREFLKQA